MSNNNSKNSNKEEKKGFFSILLSQIFQEEPPKNKEELLKLIRDSEENSLIDQDTYNMLKGVIDITKKRIKDIMIPRPQMITLKLNYSLDQCLDIIIKSAHSRFPVISQNENYVEGMLIAKDLLPLIKHNTTTFYIKKMLRPTIVVPESKYVNLMLKEFRLTKNHMAIVIDEFGVVSGLITIEDILELIVGDIEDEYDETTLNIRQLDKYTFVIKSLTPIKEFNNKFQTNFNDEEVDTIGGLIMKKIGHLPIKGEVININKFKFKINIVTNRRIILLQVTIPNK
ncbi:MAG: CNNM family magnesium/cobalt transport protein CorC [Buchnera aphidicola (Chaetogeoica yunlongensis)]